MDDLISRQAAMDTLNDEFTIIGKTNAIIVRDYIRRVKNRLHDLPSAQPERKKGRWLPDNNNYFAPYFVCSNCHSSYKVDTVMNKPTWNYCPNCGADMRQEGQDETD